MLGVSRKFKSLRKVIGWRSAFVTARAVSWILSCCCRQLNASSKVFYVLCTREDFRLFHNAATKVEIRKIQQKTFVYAKAL